VTPRNTRNTPPPDSPHDTHTSKESEQKEIAKNQARFRRQAGDAAQAFMQFWRKTKEESAIPGKYKELMQLAIVLTMHCRPCIDIHTRICVQVGCSREEILDAANVALAMGGGPVFEYTGYLMQALDEYLPPKNNSSPDESSTT
jgi:AhpD family alkylhydroperoxidase